MCVCMYTYIIIYMHLATCTWEWKRLDVESLRVLVDQHDPHSQKVGKVKQISVNEAKESMYTTMVQIQSN